MASVISSVVAKGSDAPCTITVGIVISPRCSLRARSGLPGGCNGYDDSSSPAASVAAPSSATTIDACLPP
ncbi:Uncharacterised protein [Mycobacteroides abscessus subsp. abscessus]|nr:Uncharacterised protein [Mycobacteroides abscessus subsp. abscessus]